MFDAGLAHLPRREIQDANRDFDAAQRIGIRWRSFLLAHIIDYPGYSQPGLGRVVIIDAVPSLIDQSVVVLVEAVMFVHFWPGAESLGLQSLFSRASSMRGTGKMGTTPIRI